MNKEVDTLFRLIYFEYCNSKSSLYLPPCRKNYEFFKKNPYDNTEHEKTPINEGCGELINISSEIIEAIKNSAKLPRNDKLYITLSDKERLTKNVMDVRYHFERIVECLNNKISFFFWKFPLVLIQLLAHNILKNFMLIHQNISLN